MKIGKANWVSPTPSLKRRDDFSQLFPLIVLIMYFHFHLSILGKDNMLRLATPASDCGFADFAFRGCQGAP